MSTTSSLKDIQSSVAKMTVKPRAEELTNGSEDVTDNGTCTDDGTQLVAVACDQPVVAMPEACEQQEPVVQSVIGEIDSPAGNRSRAGTGPSDCPAERSRSGSASSELSHQSGLGSLSASPQHKPQQAGTASVPLSLADLQNPNMFTLDRTPPSKRKITKASFANPTGRMADVAKDTSDPLNMLDPLWTVKASKPAGSGQS